MKTLKHNGTKKGFHFSLLDKDSGSVPSGNITFILAFCIPAMIFTALYYLRDIFPFGTNCYLRSDMYHQYAPFFSELWNKLRNGGSLTYSWDIGMGVNFLSLFAYYLASPANWLIALFPQKYIIEVMNALIIIKMSASAVTFSYYISRHFRTKKCTVALFGMFYALSGYVAAYSWNIMWLDCILLLPLIMLGLELLVNENKCFLYCISLGLCIFTNYYISIMVCISVILYFVVLIISYSGKKSPVIYLKKILRWCIYSLLAGGLAACLLLPELYTFSLSASSSVSFPKTLTSYFSVMEVLVRQLMNVPVHLGLEHYPNIYCGVAVFLLIPLYIMNKKIKPAEKIGKCVILLIFITAFNLNIPNFIWHGFHYPNSLPCRQSFIYIFFLIAMSYEAFHYVRQISGRQFAGAVWLALGFLFIAEQIFADNENYDFKIFYISGLFILLYALLLYIHRNRKFKIPVVFFLAFAAAVAECTLNMETTGIGTTSRTSYLLDYNAVKTVTETVAADDSSFYRMDKITGARTKNDGAWHNYRTISTFSSTCSAGMSELYDLLGIVNSTNAYGYDGSTMVTNSLFSVKYLISNKLLTTDSLRTYYTGYDGEFIYKNEYTLPVGYVTQGNLSEKWEPDSIYNGIENQNTLIQAMTGVSDVFTHVYTYPSQTEVTFSPEQNGHMYLVIQKDGIENVGVTINGVSASYSGLKNGNRTIDIGYVTTDDEIIVGAESSMNLHVYTLDENKFKQCYEILSQNSFQTESFSDTSFKGTVNASQDGTFLFSIPYDKGWSVYIDGKKADTYAVQNALLAVDITSGSHTVSLKFVPVNFIKGCIITFICIIILVGIAVFKRMCRKEKISLAALPQFVQDLLNEKDEVINDSSKLSAQPETAHDNETSDYFDRLDLLDDFDNLELSDENNDTEEQ